MNVQELFNLGNEFYSEGRIETAMEIWNKVRAIKGDFAPVYLQQHNVYSSQGNLVKARECIVAFLNCPVSGFSLDAIPSMKARLQDLDKQLNPQIVQISQGDRK